jgi:hypothetical protein
MIRRRKSILMRTASSIQYRTTRPSPHRLPRLGTWQRNYMQVQAPALAIYASTFFPRDHSDAALAQKLRTFEQDVMVPFRQASMKRIRRELPGLTVLELAGRTHMSVDVERPDELGAAVRDFLRGQAMH